jgi:hypothetical protein
MHEWQYISNVVPGYSNILYRRARVESSQNSVMARNVAAIIRSPTSASWCSGRSAIRGQGTRCFNPLFPARGPPLPQSCQIRVIVKRRSTSLWFGARRGLGAIAVRGEDGIYEESGGDETSELLSTSLLSAQKHQTRDRFCAIRNSGIVVRDSRSCNCTTGWISGRTIPLPIDSTKRQAATF